MTNKVAKGNLNILLLDEETLVASLAPDCLTFRISHTRKFVSALSDAIPHQRLPT